MDLIRYIKLLPLLFFFASMPAYGFEFSGFSDVTLSHSKDDRSEFENSPFAIGQIDLYASHYLDNNLNVLIEVVIEAPGGGEWVTDLERIQIGYYFNDQFELRAGRFHNPIGYWNVAFHHATLLHAAITRPKFLEFEDENGILPTHMVGLWSHGWFENVAGGFSYDVVVGNGSRLVTQGAAEPSILDPNNSADDNKNKALTLKLDYEPVFLPGFSLGLSGYSATVNSDEDAAVPVEVDQMIYGVNLSANLDKIELLSEIFKLDHSDNIGGAGDTSGRAGYIQLGYIIDDWTPYTRYEALKIDDDDPYFTALGVEDYNQMTFGVKYDIRSRSAIKAELRVLDNLDEDKIKEYAMQWAFLF